MQQKSWRRRWLKRLGVRVFRGTNAFFGAMSLVPDRAVFDRNSFPWARLIERNAGVVQREADGILAQRDLLPAFQDIAVNQGRISPDDKWKVFMLRGFGVRSDQNCALCPETAALLDSIPGIETAFFSVLAPGKHIPRHRGVTRALLRCHLGVRIPRPPPSCHMDVAGHRVVWREGESVVFDDTRPHEVWNRSDQERVVLLIDVRRPMRWPGRLLFWLLSTLLRQTHFVRDGIANQLRWEATQGKRMHHQNASPSVK